MTLLRTRPVGFLLLVLVVIFNLIAHPALAAEQNSYRVDFQVVAEKTPDSGEAKIAGAFEAVCMPLSSPCFTTLFLSMLDDPIDVGLIHDGEVIHVQFMYQRTLLWLTPVGNTRLTLTPETAGSHRVQLYRNPADLFAHDSVDNLRHAPVQRIAAPFPFELNITATHFP